MIQIGSVVFEIWPGKLKSRGGAFIQAGAFIRQNKVCQHNKNEVESKLG